MLFLRMIIIYVIIIKDLGSKVMIVMKELLNSLKFVWGYAKDQKKNLVTMIILSIISIIYSVIIPILSARIIIELTSNNYVRIIVVALVIFIVEMMYDFIDYLTRMYSIKMYRNILSVLSVDIGRNILKLENEILDKIGSGVFIQRITSDTSRLASVFNDFLALMSRLLSYVGILIAIFIVNKLVFIYVIITLTILYILEKIRTNQKNEDDKISRKANERVSGFVSELVRGARDIKMLNSENDFIGELKLRIDDANDKKFKMEKTSWSYKLTMFQIRDFLSFMLIVLLVVLIERKIILPAVALVLYNYVNNISWSFYIIGDLLDYIKDFNLSSQRIYEIINSDEFEKEKFGNIHLEKINGDFEFKNVTFGYKEKKVLDNLSFKINANETVAFVGRSGAGKTTIFNLLCKMYDINQGSITIDGINIKELDKETIRGNITVISQNPYIFNMSIRDNLKLVKSDLTDAEMEKACKIACLEEFINDLPNGYDTVIGEGGVNLSGGQKQRLAIARALVQKTEIILFDEATSALDNETQTKIKNAIDNMKNEYTILIIAHRLSTIINSDRILYLEDGKIKAEGKHKVLLKNCDEYKKLYESEITKDDNL